MKKIIFTILVFSLLIISGCGEKQTVEDLQKEIEEKDKIIEELQKENDNLKLGLGNLKIIKEAEELIIEHIDTTKWSSDDYVKAMIPYAPKLVNNNRIRYLYNEKGAYYYLEADIFDVDPFYSIVYDLDNTEYNTSRLRVFGLGFGDLEKGEEKYAEYESKVDRKELLDDGLFCEKSVECGGLKVIKCEKSGQTYTSWSDRNYLFIIRNDDQVLEAFKKFYCK